MTEGQTHDRPLAEAAVPGVLRAIAGRAYQLLTADPAGSWQNGLAPLIALLGDALAVDHVQLFELADGAAGVAQVIRRMQWPAAGDGAASIAGGGERIAVDKSAASWLRTLREGGTVHTTVPADAPARTRLGLPPGSVALAPLLVDGACWGILAALDVDPDRAWSGPELAGLAHVALAFGGMVQDRLTKETLAEIRARYQTLVEQIPAILYVDLPQEGRTAYVSPQLEPILGVTPHDWLTKHELWEQMLHPEDQDWVLAQYREFVTGHGPDLAEYRMVRPDGGIVWIRDRARTVRNRDGQVVVEQGLMLDVTELKLAEAGLQRHAELLERVDTISRQLTELVLAGGDAGRILRMLANAVGNPVVLEDAAHQLIEFAVHSAPVEDVLEAWDAHSRTGHPENPNGVMVEHAGTPRCAWIPLWIRGDLWGRLHVLEVDKALDEADQFPLDRAAAAVSLALLSQRDAARLSEDARNTLIADIARGRVVGAGEIIRRARGLGAELEGRTLLGMVVEFEDLGQANGELTEHDRQRVRTRVLEDVRRILAGARCASLSGLEGDRVLALVGLPRNRPGAPVLDELGESIFRRLRAADPDMPVAVGFSRPNPRPAFDRLLKEAMEAATFGGGQPDGRAVHHYGQLGVHHLLVLLAQGPELSGFVESELNPLLEHDATAKVPLLPTLVAYLQHGGSKSAAARALSVERRTLYFRIERIQKLLGKHIDDRDTWLRLELAVRALDVLKHRSPGVSRRRPAAARPLPDRQAPQPRTTGAGTVGRRGLTAAGVPTRSVKRIGAELSQPAH